eukprot:9082941-Pyramimonas_sp.AAC.1
MRGCNPGSDLRHHAREVFWASNVEKIPMGGLARSISDLGDLGSLSGPLALGLSVASWSSKG